LLLARATGLRVGEIVDLELDCVHEIPGQGAWLKVPLGKLDTERMVPIDEETLTLVDRIVARRSPGRPIPHPRTGRPTEFLLTITAAGSPSISCVTCSPGSPATPGYPTPPRTSSGTPTPPPWSTPVSRCKA
jgi:hypothetical protein